jgi:hypothetical protein
MKKYIATIVALMGLTVATFGESIPLDTTLTFTINITDVEGSYQPSTDAEDFVMAQVSYRVDVPVAGHVDVRHARVDFSLDAHQIKVMKEEVCQAAVGQSYTTEVYNGLTLNQLRTAVIGVARAKFLAAMAQQ